MADCSVVDRRRHRRPLRQRAERPRSRLSGRSPATMTRAFEDAALKGTLARPTCCEQLALALSSHALEAAWRRSSIESAAGRGGLGGSFVGRRPVRGPAVRQRRRHRLPITFPLAGRRSAWPAKRGPEAILPLARGPDGRLGVRGGGAPALNVTFNVTDARRGELPPLRRRRSPPCSPAPSARGAAGTLMPTHDLSRGPLSRPPSRCGARRAGAAHRDRRARLRPRGAQQPLGRFAPPLQRRLRRQVARRPARRRSPSSRSGAGGSTASAGATAPTGSRARPARRRRALDQTIGTGDGAARDASSSSRPTARPSRRTTRVIAKPVAGTVLVAVDGVEQTAAATSRVDAATGSSPSSPGTIPASGAAVTAGFEFDVPVRFDTDRLEINLAALRARRHPAIPIVEIRLP